MSKRYKCVTSWVRHSKGEIIPEHEYAKLPHEIKISGAFVELIDEVNLAPTVTPAPPVDVQPEVIEAPAVEEPLPTDVEEPLDPVLSTVTIDPFNDRKNKRR